MKDNRIKPKKSLGQNFLNDKNIAAKIVNALEIQDGDIIVEIGPGTGVLTELLVEKNIRLYAIEYDSRAVEILNSKFPKKKYPNVDIMRGDFLETDLKQLLVDSCQLSVERERTSPTNPNIEQLTTSNQQLTTKPGIEQHGTWDMGHGTRESEMLTTNNQKLTTKLKVIGNIPYNISSEIMFKLFDSSELIDKSILMLQKEVAHRLTAKPRTKDYGILTLVLNLVGSAKILFDVPPKCFYPQPKVTSSIVRFNFDKIAGNKHNYFQMKELIRAAFSQRRKVLRNSLKNFILSHQVSTPEGRKNLNIEEIINAAEKRNLSYFCKRAEELTVDDYYILYNLIFP